jgi:hypothetical protein
MAVKTRITSFANTAKILVDSTLSPKARIEKVRIYTQREITKADEINRRALGAVPPKTITVNGRADDESLSGITADRGIIIAEWRLVGDVLEWIMTTLRERSPVVSGDYRDGHIMLADGAEADPFHPPMATSFTFLNTVPYARKIEIGKTESGHPFVVQVENKIYFRTYQDAKARFGNIAKITTGFESSSYVLRQNQLSRSFTGGVKRISARQRPDRTAGAAVSVPAIYVTIGG